MEMKLLPQEIGLKCSVTYTCSLEGLASPCCCWSVTKSCAILCDPIDSSTPGFPVLYCLPEFAQTHAHWVMMPSNHFIFCHPLLLLPSIFPNIRLFSSELAFHIRWPKYWSFSCSISPSNEYWGLISLGLTDLLAVQGTLKSLLQRDKSKALILQFLAFFIPQLWHLYMTYWTNHSFDYVAFFQQSDVSAF